MTRVPAALVLATLLSGGCAALGRLGALVLPPQFEQAADRPVDVQLTGPSASSLLGAATVRIWTRVTNPNPYGFTLSTLSGTLFLEDRRAATAEFPLGLPLAAGGEAVIPLEFLIDFADIPNLVNVVRRAAAREREPVAYRFDGSVGVDAGRLGAPVFGPLTFARGTIGS
jgi:hypothetical protein